MNSYILSNYNQQSDLDAKVVQKKNSLDFCIRDMINVLKPNQNKLLNFEEAKKVI